MEPRVSVVIAAYRPGDGFDRVLASLDAQTLPQDQFETVVVDDGSPDDTFERLTAAAATRPNMRVERIENSGWPSRPRNVGTDLARAPYVLYVDHDDTLYPDALRRLVEYAAETGADVVSAKESQTRSVWWGTLPFRHGNVANAIPGGDIHDLMPMIPHKLYRKAFLLEHGIRFPEGKRQLWEDIFFNVAAWRHARVVALLADTPVYLWHLTESNNSGTYGPGGMEFWNRLDVLFAFIDRTLDGEAYARARRDQLLHQWRSRAVKRFAKLAGTASEERTLRTLPRAQAVLTKYVPEEQDPLLGMIARPHTVLTRLGRIDLLGELWRLEQKIEGRVKASNVRWVDGVLEADVVTRWRGPDGTALRVIERDGRLLRDLPEHIAAALPVESIDVTDTLDSFLLRVGAHSRADHLTWDAPVEQAATTWEAVAPGIVTPVSRGRLRLDPTTAAAGRPLSPAVWELSGIVHWSDVARSQGLRVRIRAMPALPGGVVATAYTNTVGTLALDLTGQARSVVAEGGLSGGRVRGGVGSFVLPLPRVRAWGAHRIPVAVRFAPRAGASTTLDAALVADDAGVRLEAGGAVAAGRYRLGFQPPGGVDRLTRWSALVSRRGSLVLLDTGLRPSRASIARLRAQAGRIVRGVRRRLAR